jgi:hypothetical protein
MNAQHVDSATLQSEGRAILGRFLNRPSKIAQDARGFIFVVTAKGLYGTCFKS